MELETIPAMGARIAALETALKAAIGLKLALTKLDMPDYDDTLNELMPRLGAEITPLSAEKARRKAMKEKYLPIHAERVMGIPREVTLADSRLKSKADEIEKARKKLTDAGLTATEARQMKPDYDAEADNALITSFRAEMAQWERFNATGLHGDLPEDANERLRNYLEVTPKDRRHSGIAS